MLPFVKIKLDKLPDARQSSKERKFLIFVWLLIFVMKG